MKNARTGKRGIIVSNEILNLRNLKNPDNKNVIDVAFPVLAFECEVSVPVEKEVDAYQEAVLKLISIGLTKKNIQKTLNITESLCGAIFANMETHRYIENTSRGYALTEKAYNYLNNFEITNPDTESKFGYILTNAIKKEPLWYFYEGDILNIPRSDSKLIENKLTIGNNEVETFKNTDIPGWRLEKAFSMYCRIIEAQGKYKKSETSDEEIIELFADIEADLSEADYQNGNEESTEDDSEVKISTVSKKSKVRKLNREPVKLYLQMQIIIDPSVPGGFRVESPFDFYGNDNELFLRQIQWIINPDNNAYIFTNKFSEFMTNEINKLIPNRINEKSQIDRNLYINNKLPILYKYKDKYPNIYKDICEIIDLIQQKNLTILAKENIVGSLNKYLLEYLMKRLFQTVSEENGKKISKQAYRDFTFINKNEDKIAKQNKMTERFVKLIGVDRSVLPQDTDIIYSAIKRLKYTKGNSIYEKLLNLIVYQYYQPSPQIRRFFQSEGIEDYIKTVDEMNKIRNSAIHSISRPFTDKDYNYYIDHVYDVVNRLLEALKEEE